jgi:hypothetical protein
MSNYRHDCYKAKAMYWISVKEALPENEQAVLVRYARDNWPHKHIIDGGEKRKFWRWQAARFVLGRTAEEVEKTKSFCSEDVYGNNLVPYCWKLFGPGILFGQDVTHWAAITDPCEENLNDNT